MTNTRRQFLGKSGRALGAGWLAISWPSIAAAAAHAAQHAGAHASAAPAHAPSLILTAAQLRDIEAICAQIIPTDDVPGAREAGTVHFIDYALGAFFAVHQQEIISGYDDFAAGVAKSFSGKVFADLPLDSQIAHLRSTENTPFFGAIRFLTIVGFLVAPGYGGNRDGIGWQVIGFGDEHAFLPPFGYYDRDYAGFVPYSAAVKS